MSLFGNADLSHTQHDISRRIAALGRELSRLAGQASYSAGHEVEHATNSLAALARRQAPRLARMARRQARLAGATVARDPLPAVMALAGLACLASLVLASRKS